MNNAKPYATIDKFYGIINNPDAIINKLCEIIDKPYGIID